MIASSLLAILASAILIAEIGRRDPKRLRSQHASADAPSLSPMPSGLRRLLGWLVIVPGIALVFLGEWWAFLVWFGAMCVAGWVTSLLMSRNGLKPA